MAVRLYPTNISAANDGDTMTHPILGTLEAYVGRDAFGDRWVLIAVADTSKAPLSAPHESGHLSWNGVPKVAFYDETVSTYKTLYGKLFHQIRINDEEFLPNVVVVNVVAGSPDDTVSYCRLTEAIDIAATAHGFEIGATLYVGSDGETTTDPTASHRSVIVGVVKDANTLTFVPPKQKIDGKGFTQTFPDVTVADRFKTTSYASISTNGGGAHIYRDDASHIGTPTSAEYIAALCDIDSADEIRPGATNTGIDINLVVQAFVSDLDLQIARLFSWRSGDGARANFNVLVYTRAADGSPAQTIPVWSAIGEIEPGRGLTTTIAINQLCEKIELQWDASTGVLESQGALQQIALYGKKRRTTVTIGANQPKFDFDKIEIAPKDKLILLAEHFDFQTADQLGVADNVNEIYGTYAFGLSDPWNPSPGTPIDNAEMDSRSYRRFVHEGTANYDLRRQFLSIDYEYTAWDYHPDDNAATIAQKDARWANAFAIIRGITPGKMIGTYGIPHRANINSMQSYIRAASGQDTFRRAKEREKLADFVYDNVDFVCPTMYQNDESQFTFDDWLALMEFHRDHAHANGRLLVPHISGWQYGVLNQLSRWEAESNRTSGSTFNYSEAVNWKYLGPVQGGETPWAASTSYTTGNIVSANSVLGVALPDPKKYFDAALDIADGIMIWDSSIVSPYTDAEREAYAADVRAAIEEAQAESLPYRHLNVLAGVTVPNVDGYTSIKTNGSGDTITDFAGGKVGKLLRFELTAGDTIQAGTGKIDFGANGPASPYTPVTGAVMDFRYDGTEWILQFYQ